MMDDTVRIMGIGSSNNNRSEVVTPHTLLHAVQQRNNPQIIDLRTAPSNQQQRVHSLSQYAQLPTYQGTKVVDSILLMDNLKATKAIHINQSNTVRNTTTMRNTAQSIGPTAQSVSKPLNKITWDSFSQIAKLTGDVDHEPSTPKSGQAPAQMHSDDDEEGYDIE
ncbi:hypothetical protein FGO68_gene17783 [Halteria grandinella]|uniref:Uncharacterized protein n=1 Tax=Halteria grandinella TaxID=5974 RepID=A0A8J8SXM6_HALGN|nr:hypothetical protein FGO68_gene17783 [Halteria grandinella]